MAIPVEPLEIHGLDVAEMTLGELELLTDPSAFSAKRFIDFLQAHASWTPEQIRDIKLGELSDVARQLGAAIERTAVPKANAPS